jgi:hypothetical protein
MEQAFLDANSTPILTVSYDDDATNPKVHAEIENIIKDHDLFRLLVLRKATFGSVSASNAEYMNHMKEVKAELRTYIAQSMLVPTSIFKESPEKQQNVREVIQAFIKYRLPALFSEIIELMTWQFGRRLIDANYSNVSIDEYPTFSFNYHIDNDLRVAMPLLLQTIPYMDASRLGESLEKLIPGFRKEWIPEKHTDSVDVERPRRDANDTFQEIGINKGTPPDTTGTPNEGGAGPAVKPEIGKQTDVGA